MCTEAKLGLGFGGMGESSEATFDRMMLTMVIETITQVRHVHMRYLDFSVCMCGS